MTSRAFTLIDAGEARQVRARVSDGAVRLAPEALEAALGWRLEAQGLCRGDVCVPLADRAALAGADGIDLAALAEALHRPLALDLEEGAAALGTDADERRRSLQSLEAPDFELPDLDGRLHRLSDHRGKKVLLIAYASW
jgi:hypothetical protein